MVAASFLTCRTTGKSGNLPSQTGPWASPCAPARAKEERLRCIAWPLGGVCNESRPMQRMQRNAMQRNETHEMQCNAMKRNATKDRVPEKCQNGKGTFRQDGGLRWVYRNGQCALLTLLAPRHRKRPYLLAGGGVPQPERSAFPPARSSRPSGEKATAESPASGPLPANCRSSLPPATAFYAQLRPRRLSENSSGSPFGAFGTPLELPWLGFNL